MRTYDQLMNLFKILENGTRDHAPVSPQDWEAVKCRILKLMMCAHNSCLELSPRALGGKDDVAMSGMIAAQAVTMMMLQISLELLPIGKSYDFADFHQERVRNQFKEWAKQTGDLADKMRSSSNESSAVN